jgi:hypothetical protein
VKCPAVLCRDGIVVRGVQRNGFDVCEVAVAAGVWFEEGLLCTAPAVDTVLNRLLCAEGVAYLLCVTMCVVHTIEEPREVQ